MPTRPPVSIFWFRRDLRLHDNTALAHATSDKYPVVPIFIFDPNIIDHLADRDDCRITFIYDQIVRLKNALEMLDSSLWVYFATPEQAFKELFQKFNVKQVFVNRDYEPYAIARDGKIAKLARATGADFRTYKDQVIFEGTEVLKQDGTPFKVFTPYKNAWLSRVFDNDSVRTTFSINSSRFHRSEAVSIPTLQMLGFTRSSIPVPGNIPDINIISSYDQNRDFPALNGTTRIGVHLRFGTVSIREMVKLAIQHNATWLNELIWREFYSAILQHFPYVIEGAFNRKYNVIPWINNEKQFEAWCQGKTGYPIVDAGMRELNATGYMHNRVRMITASFLTKHLLVDWRWGEAYFMRKLLDFDLASNNGGWQWAAGTGTDAQPYFRVFNPESQAVKFDHNQQYIRKWVPELGTKEYPNPIVDHKMARERAIETYRKAVS